MIPLFVFLVYLVAVASCAPTPLSERLIQYPQRVWGSKTQLSSPTRTNPPDRFRDLKPTGKEITPVINNREVFVKSQPSRSDDKIQDEMLCQLQLYQSLLLQTSRGPRTSIDLQDDRLIFLIPLIIIYWHHRHPHQMIPLESIQLMLPRLSESENSVQMLLLKRMIFEINSRGGRCYNDIGKQAFVNLEDSKGKARDALEHVKLWSESSKARADRYYGMTESGVLNQTSHQVTPQLNFDKLYKNSLNLTRVASDEPSSTTLPAPETTTEPYGWPHYENRTTVRPSRMLNVEASGTTPSGVATVGANKLENQQFMELLNVVSSFATELRPADITLDSEAH